MNVKDNISKGKTSTEKDFSLKVFIKNFLVEQKLTQTLNCFENEAFKNLNICEDVPIKSNKSFIYDWYENFWYLFSETMLEKFREINPEEQNENIGQINMKCLFKDQAETHFKLNEHMISEANILKTLENYNGMGIGSLGMDNFGGYINNDLTQNLMSTIEKSIYNQSQPQQLSSYPHFSQGQLIDAVNSINSMGGPLGGMNNINNMSMSMNMMNNMGNQINGMGYNGGMYYGNNTSTHSFPTNGYISDPLYDIGQGLNQNNHHNTNNNNHKQQAQAPAAKSIFKTESRREKTADEIMLNKMRARSIKNNKIVYCHSNKKKGKIPESVNNNTITIPPDDFNILDENNESCGSADGDGGSQNGKKQRGSRFRGVSRNGNQWQVLIMVKKKKRYVGSYSSEIEAAKAYDKVALQNHDSRAKTNFDYNDEQISKIKKEPKLLKLKEEED